MRVGLEGNQLGLREHGKRARLRLSGPGDLRDADQAVENDGVPLWNLQIDRPVDVDQPTRFGGLGEPATLNK